MYIHNYLPTKLEVKLIAIVYMWPALPKPATYAHHVNEQFSPSMDSSINKLTNCQYTTAKCWRVCFYWGMFLRPVRRPRVLGCSLNATGRLLQATTLLEITIRLVDDIPYSGKFWRTLTFQIFDWKYFDGWLQSFTKRCIALKIWRVKFWWSGWKRQKRQYFPLYGRPLI